MGAAIGQILPLAAVIMAVICLIIGAKLIGDAIGGFSSDHLGRYAAFTAPQPVPSGQMCTL